MELNTSSDDYFDELRTLAREDPPLAVRLLAIANSANSSPASSTNTVREAMTRVGAGTIVRQMAASAVQRAFMPTTVEQLDLWRHAQKVALVCEHIALRSPQLGLARGDAYLAGLLHDIGRFVMFEHAARKLNQVNQAHWHSPEELVRAEAEVFRFTHSELGYLACTHWGLPSHLARVVRAHHNHLEPDVEPGSVDALNLCVQVADRVDIFVLGRNDIESLSLRERAGLIERDCLAPLGAVDRVDASNLAEQVDRFNRKCREMLVALGIG